MKQLIYHDRLTVVLVLTATVLVAVAALACGLYLGDLIPGHM